MPKKRVAVILGAGASHSINAGGRTLDDRNYRPPLTAGIFQDTYHFKQILRTFPLAEILSGEIDRRSRRNSLNLERILRGYADGLAAGMDNHITRQFLQIPLYINTLFGATSSNFTKNPFEYNMLVNEALEHADETLFLTVNYDTILEVPLASIFRIDFSKPDHYIHPKWMLVKLHGSINWYRRILHFWQGQDRLEQFLLWLNTVPLPLALETEIVMTAIHHAGVFVSEGSPRYPAITVPVDEKYDINCPNLLVEKARDFLQECNNYLVVGTSATDRDLLDILKQRAKAGRLVVVGRSEEGTRQTTKQLIEAVPQLGEEAKPVFGAGGFTDFVDSGQLHEFFVSLK